MKKLLFFAFGLLLSAGCFAQDKQENLCPRQPKNDLTQMVIAHISEHGILTQQELADFTAIYCELGASKRKLNQENRQLKKQLKECTDSQQIMALMQQIANNDLTRAQLDKEALDAYMQKIDAARLVQVLQCSENYKNEIFKNMRIKRQEMQENKDK